MPKPSPEMTPDEEKVQRLVALKRYEQPHDGYFESFLAEFQQRQREEMLSRSSLSLLLERAGTWVRELGMAKWLIGAGVAYGALTLAYLGWQGKATTATTNIVPASYQQPIIRTYPQANPIQKVDFENGKRYPTDSRARDHRREF